jgi:Pyridoxal-phosphate dependent enzyme
MISLSAKRLAKTMRGQIMKYIIPQIAQYRGVSVVREDLIAGGTKGRFIHLAFKGTDTVAYASSHCGGGQVALAGAAKRLGKRCVIFTAARGQLHRRQFEAQALGAEFHFIRPGYQSVLNARLRDYCQSTGARPAPFGLAVEGCEDIIAEAAVSTKAKPSFVWVACGSGTLARGLQKAFPKAELHCVLVGAKSEIPGAVMHEFPKPYGWVCQADVPFPIDQHYEAKTYKLMKTWQAETKPRGEILFWNTMASPKV